MSPDLPSSWEPMLSSSPIVAAFIIGIRYLLQSLKEQRDSNSALLAQLSQERNERLDAMEAHIERCESHIKECDADRQNLRLELVKLAQQRTQVTA